MNYKIDLDMMKNKRLSHNRSLKGRITKMVSVVNFTSLFIMLVALMLALGLAFSLFSRIVSDNVGSQMAHDLGMMWNNKSAGDKALITNKTKEPYNVDMFIRLGQAYRFSKMSGGKINTSELPEIIHQIGNEKKTDALSVKANNGKENTALGGQIKGFVPDFDVVQYKVHVGNKVVFNSASEDSFKIVSYFDNNYLTMKILNTTTYVDVKDDKGNVVATLEVKLNPNIIFFGYIGLLFICIIVFLLTLCLSKMIIKFLSPLIVKPLVDLGEKMNKLANGNLDAAMSSEIVLKRPIREVDNLVNSTNKIMSRMHEYINTLASQKVELEAQNINLQENGSVLENVNLTLAHKNSKLKNILNNVEQGFLTFKRDLIIHDEYSLICEKFFKGSLGGKTLSSMLYPLNYSNQKFIDELLVKIFNSTSSDRKIYIPLLPEEVTINDIVANISYKFVKDEKNEDSIMAIITDITEKRLLEKQMDEERKTLKMVVKSIINRSEFLELVKEYEDFAEEMFDNISQKEFDNILRQIHTFKGNFSQYDMVTLVTKLNELEDRIYEEGDLFNIGKIDNKALKGWLKDDLDIILSYAGKDFMKEGEYCYIKKDKLMEIERKIQQTLTQNECKVILPMIKSLRYQSVIEMLKTYPDYVMKLSERLEKTIKPIEITGDEVMIDGNNYHQVIKSLTHIFRNCVDHGIETEDERLETGKEQYGEIKVQINDLKDSVQIVISDDGRGIDIEALEDKAVESRLYTREELDKMTRDQKYELIFEQGITTKTEPTLISGRGIGMSAVKQCILDIGGSILVDSEPGKGTEFIISLPITGTNEGYDVNADQFMEEVIKTAKDIILKQTGLEFNSKAIEYKNNIVLDKTTALLSLTGTLNSIIMISVNDSMAKKLVYSFIIDNIQEQDVSGYLEDVIGELSNTILGNAFGSFQNTNGLFHIGLPAVLSNSDAYVKYTESQIISSKLICGEFELSINMLLIEEELNSSYIEEE